MEYDIAICASMAFSKAILETKKQLEDLGYKVAIPKGTEKNVKENIGDEDKWAKLDHDPIRKYFQVINNSQAVLILNYEKHNIQGYIGGNTLIELAFAHALEKQKYITHNIDEESYSLAYKDEILAMQPVHLHEGLESITKYVRPLQ